MNGDPATATGIAHRTTKLADEQVQIMAQAFQDCLSEGSLTWEQTPILNVLARGDSLLNHTYKTMTERCRNIEALAILDSYLC